MERQREHIQRSVRGEEKRTKQNQKKRMSEKRGNSKHRCTGRHETKSEQCKQKEKLKCCKMVRTNHKLQPEIIKWCQRCGRVKERKKTNRADLLHKAFHSFTHAHSRQSVSTLGELINSIEKSTTAAPITDRANYP